ncbi:MAG TPA: DUF1376 domain-containing protein [Gemmatimonadaceae bacterium]|nr:DUF1376 domain-containing protein [Gemmatimonadaceae bacterium]
MKSPAFQFYPDDYMGGKPGLMTPEQTHVYIWLLCLDWNQHGFTHDEETLARWCRVKPSVFRRAWVTVQGCFTCDDGRWFNERLQREREKQEEYRQKMAENGKKGGRPPKAEPNQKETSGFKSANQNESTPLPTPLPTKNNLQTPTPSGPARGKPAPWMGEINRVWGEVFPEATAPKGAAKMLSPVVDKFGIERVAAELGVYLRATQPQFLSLPKFVATFGGSSVAGSITPKKNPVEQEAEDVWTLCKRYGFAQCTRSTIDGELQRALDAGDIDDVEAFRAKLRRLDIPFLRAVQSDKAAVRSIAERLVA